MWDVFTFAAGNLGVSFETVVVVVLLIGNLIFFAKNFLIGLIMMFVINAGVFAWFYSAGLNYSYPLIIFFLSLVLLSLSLYLTSKSVDRGALI